MPASPFFFVRTRRLRWLLGFCLIGSLSACADLLPRARQSTDGPWTSYPAAVEALEAITPYRSTLTELAKVGIDPKTTPSITMLTYSDLLQRFASGSAVSAEELDPGLRDCFRASKRCRGLLVTAGQVRRQRIGNFWLDTFNFRRETDITGWRFNAIIVLVDDRVVFTVHGGQPRMQDHEVTHNPLGPLQSFGEAVGSKFGR